MHPTLFHYITHLRIVRHEPNTFSLHYTLAYCAVLTQHLFIILHTCVLCVMNPTHFHYITRLRIVRCARYIFVYVKHFRIVCYGPCILDITHWRFVLRLKIYQFSQPDWIFLIYGNTICLFSIYITHLHILLSWVLQLHINSKLIYCSLWTSLP